MKFKNLFLLLALVSIFSIAFIGCASSPQPSVEQNGKVEPEEKDIITLAKEEGKVVYYGSAGMDPILEKLIPAFKDKYGIDVEFVSGTGKDAVERVLTEQRVGKYVADVVTSGDTTTWDIKVGGGFQKFIPTNAQYIYEDLKYLFIDPEEYYSAQYINLYGILVNTDRLKELNLEPPKTWKDLLKPEYKGQMMFHDPRRSGGGSVVFTTFLKELGEDFAEKLAEQDLMLVATPRDIESGIARGEKAIGFPALPRAMTLQEGAPIDWYLSDDGVIFIAVYSGLVNNAPHPNAGKLWIDFLLEPEAQQLFMKNDTAPVREMPNNPFKLDGKKVFEPRDPTEAADIYLELAEKYFGK